MLKRNAMALWAAFAILLAACTGANPAGSASPAAPSSAGPSTSGAPAASAGAAELTIESWRTDDLAIWQDEIIPAFEAKHPDIKVTFAPTKPDEYNGVLEHEAPGRHGRRPDHLPPVRHLARAVQGRATSRRSTTCRAWRTSATSPRAPGSPTTARTSSACRWPRSSTASSTTQDTFTKLGVTTLPTTVAEFHALLDKIKTDGTYTPLAMGTKDTVGGRDDGLPEHRAQLLEGRGRAQGAHRRHRQVHRPAVCRHVRGARQLEAVPARTASRPSAYADAQQLFASGKAAIYPAGSWDIAFFEGQGVHDRLLRAAASPNAGDTCYISDHTDIALGMNAKTTHPAEAKDVPRLGGERRVRDALLERACRASTRCRTTRSRSTTPIAQQAVDLREDVRVDDPQLVPDPVAAASPNLENELWRRQRRGHQRDPDPRGCRGGAPGRPRQAGTSLPAG